MHSWKRRLQNHRGMEFALFYLVLLFGVGAYQTIKVFMNIDLYSEQVLFGLSSHSFIAALLFSGRLSAFFGSQLCVFLIGHTALH